MEGELWFLQQNPMQQTSSMAQCMTSYAMYRFELVHLQRGGYYGRHKTSIQRWCAYVTLVPRKQLMPLHFMMM